jgi:c-di-GMP-binding flagellar brake protein YcgR
MNLLKSVIGVKIELEILQGSSSEIEGTYISQLIDIFDGNILELAIPIHKLRYKKIPVDTLVNVFFHHNENGIMSFTGKIILSNNNKKNSENSIFLILDSEIFPIQRRLHPRFDFSIDLKYSLTSNTTNNGSSSNLTYTKKTTTKNISAGGLLTTLTESFEKGSFIEFELIFVNNIIKITGEVVRSTENKYYSNEYETGIKFIKINKKDHDFLIRYIYEMQKQKV